MNTVRRPGLRILVGAGSYADAAAGLRIIEHLPSTFFAGLGGILVEEVDIFATCQIPDQRIVLLSGKTALAPSHAQLHTLLRADARAFRRILARAAGPSGAQWAFMQDKGELVRTALRAAAGWDVLVLGYRQIHKIPGKIILLQDSGTPSAEMEEASSRLSHQLSAQRVVFSIRENGDDGLDAPPSTAHQFKTLDDALAALGRQNAQAVLVDFARGPIRDQTDLLRLLEAARCPVVVFGASNNPSLLEHNTHIPPAPAKPERDDDG